jgi:hypothetical protein
VAWPTRWSNERLSLLSDLAAAGVTRAMAARVMDEDYDAVVHACKFYGIEMARSYRRWSAEELKDIIRRLRAGFTVGEVAAQIGVKPQALQSILQYRAGQLLAAIREPRKKAEVTDWVRYSTPRSRPEVKAQPPCDPRFRDGLYREAHALVPRDLPRYIRDDVMQEVILAVLEGERLDVALVRKKIKAVWRLSPPYLSLDEPVGYGSDRLLRDVIAGPDRRWR